MQEAPDPQAVLLVVADPYDGAGIVGGGGETAKLLGIEGPGFRELEALQAVGGTSFGGEHLRRAQSEPEHDGLVLLLQEARLVAGREHLFEHGELGQGVNGSFVRNGGERVRNFEDVSPPRRDKRGEISGVGMLRVFPLSRPTRRCLVYHPEITSFPATHEGKPGAQVRYSAQEGSLSVPAAPNPT